MLYSTNTKTLIIDSSDLMQKTLTYTYTEHPIRIYLLIPEISKLWESKENINEQCDPSVKAIGDDSIN